jgi:hydrogenase/urease accessory protein HupE
MLRSLIGAAWIAGLALLSPTDAAAHALAPSLLEIRETEPGRAEVQWKTPVFGVPGAELRPVLPADCAITNQPEVNRVEAAYIVRWSVDCGTGSFVGRRIGASGIADSRANVLLRVTTADGRSFRSVLTAERPSFTVPERQPWIEVANAYFVLGVGHILTGADHLLFVFGLLLLISGARQLLWTLTSFTLGHSLTLSLAVLGFVRIPQAPAEAAIAASIFVLAAELARGAGAPPTLMRRFPWAMAALFGLLHGLGFAGALAEIGLPPGDIPLALFSFNLGIEAGQVIFVAGVLALRGAVAFLPVRAPKGAELVPAYVIGSLAAFWFFERLALTLRFHTGGP